MHARAQRLQEVKRASRQRSVAEVLADVLSNLQDILHSEISLARVQARAELRNFRSAGVLMVVGVLGGLLSAFFLLFAIVAALSLVISLWVAALLVAIVMAVVCAVLLRRGARLVRTRAEKVAAGVAASAEESTPWTAPPTE
jgi:Flp pilus assembly protein TadB